MIEIRNLCRTYETKSGPVRALDGVNLKIEDTGMVFILGKSGSGKSTLLNVLGGLDKYDSGEIIIKGKSSSSFSGSDFDSYRNTFIGFIFQEYNILEEFTVGKNIGLALELQGKKATKEAILDILKQVDLEGYGDRKPNTLSGGQKQRVAIARALIKSPEIIMADEPTGALDSATGKQVFDTLKKLSETKLVLVVSHDREFAEIYGDRVIELMDGKVISDIKKYLAPPESVNAGVSIVDDKIISIKAGHTLSAEDTQTINAFLQGKGAAQGAIISVDAGANADFKRVARIDDSGNKESFAGTTDEKLSLKTYQEGDFQMLKSRLPFKDSLKIGASGLKAKPFRLLMTIFISFIAFGLFGLVDTLGAYNKVTATVQSIQDSNINYAAVKLFTEMGNDDYSYFSEGKMDLSDIKKLNDETEGFEFHPIYSLGDGYYGGMNYNSNLGSTEQQLGNYYNGSLYGLGEFTPQQFDALGFSKVGEWPVAMDEIAVSDYVYEHFKLRGYVDPTVSTSQKTTIDSKAALLGKTIAYSPSDGGVHQYKITAIIDTRLDSTKYESLKTVSTENGISEWMLENEFRTVISTSYHGMLFTAPGFYNQNIGNEKLTFINFNGASNAPHMSLFLQNSRPNSDGSNREHAVYVQKMGQMADITATGDYETVWFGTPKTALAENEVLVSYQGLYYRKVTYKGEDMYLAEIMQRAQEIARDAYLAEEVTPGTTRLDAFVEGDSFKEYFGCSYTENAWVLTDMLNDSLAGGKIEGYWSGIYNTNEVVAMSWEDGHPTKALAQAFITRYPTLDAYLSALDDVGLQTYFGDCTETVFETFYTGLQAVVGASETALLQTVFSDPANTAAFLEYYIYSPTYEEAHANQAISMKVVGIVKNKEKEITDMSDNILNDFVLFSDTYYQKFFVKTGAYAYAIAPIGANISDATLRELVEYTYQEDEASVFRLQNAVSSSLENVNDMIEMLAQVFLYVGIGFAVFAALILFNYISISISYKKREIGVLRAVGARGSDVFTIFFNEALIISLINFVIAAVACGVGAGLINNIIRTQYGFVITLLNFGIRQIALIFGVSVLVALLSSFFPVYRVARMRPIDAIRK